MSLPTFLVIGAQRSGSTWLHELLGSHPDVYMPERRKEIAYFNRFYDRGVEWYEEFFPKSNSEANYLAVGEATPTYLYKGDVAERISRDLPDVKLLVILRNPADRAFSHYMMLVQTKNYQKSFEELIDENPVVFYQGEYAGHLTRYMEHFDRDRFCVLLYEEAVKQVELTKARLGLFLGVSAESFPAEAGKRRVGESYVPKAARAFALAKRTARWLQANDLDWAVNLGKRQVKAMLGISGERPVFSRETRIRLLERYEADICRLEELLALDLTTWRAESPLTWRGTAK